MKTDPREQLQTESVNTFLGGNKNNSMIIPTGSGKSLICIKILKELNPTNILLLTNSQELRDNNWKAEFNKWGYKWEGITSECYQTAYKPEWQNKKWDIIIYDEVDFALSEQYQSVFTIPSTFKLGLTGFCPEGKREMLNKYLPIVFEAHTKDLQDSGSLNKSEFIFVEFPLNKGKTLEQVNRKTGAKFLVSENDQYKYYDREFQKAMIVKSSIEKKYRMMNINPEAQKDYVGAKWKFMSTATKRKSILNNLDSSITVTKNLVSLIHLKPGNKIVIFSAVTKQADKLFNPYHGKSSEDVTLESLNLGTINTLSVCKKISRGVNLVGVNYIIKESFDGGETDFVQTHGRLMRLRPDQVGKYIILVPFYEDLVRSDNGVMKSMVIPTQANIWSKKMMQSFEISKESVIRLDNTLQIPNNNLI